MDVFDVFLSVFDARVADDSKSLSEREEQDVEEHMTGHRDRPHSRDDAGIGLPATWNRRKRIEQDDPDMTSDVRSDKNPDTSLNYKSAAGKGKKEKKEKKEGRKRTPKDLTAQIRILGARLGRVSPEFAKAFHESMAQDLRDKAETKPEECAFQLSQYDHAIRDASDQYFQLFKSESDLPKAIAEAWDLNKGLFKRAGIVEALKKAAMKINLPESIKEPVMRARGSQISDKQSIKAILGSKEIITPFPEEDVGRFVTMATAWAALYGNPNSITPKAMRNEKKRKEILEQVNAVADLSKIMNVWQEAVSQFKTDDSGRVDVSEGNWGAVLEKINGFMKRPAPPADPGIYMSAIVDQLKEKYGKIPREIQAAMEGYGVETSESEKSESEESESEDRYWDKQDADPTNCSECRGSGFDPFEDNGDCRKCKGTGKAIPETSQKKESEGEIKSPEGKTEGQGQGQGQGQGPETEKVQDAMEELRKRREEREKKSRPWHADPDEAAKEFEETEKKHKEEESNRPASQTGSVFFIASRVSAASYEAVCRRMMNKSAAYHGIVYQGHPTDPPGSSPKNYDKRYFGKDHYDSIIASAKKYLGEDWLKYGWGENPGDAPVRAALDLAIGTADSGLYQSKIDAMTYGMLLNRLAGWDYDLFNETLLTGPKKARKASAMAENSSAYAILRIADSLRSDHPDLSVQIIKNVYALMRTAAEPESAPEQGQGQGDRQDDERKLIEKVVNQVRKDRKLPPLQGKELDGLVEQALSGMSSLESTKPEGSKISALGSAKLLPVMIQLAYDRPSFRKHIPIILAAAKKLKKDEKAKKVEKKAPKKEEAPEPSVPVKKVDKKDKKKDKPTKKKKASVILAASDINW